MPRWLLVCLVLVFVLCPCGVEATSLGIMKGWSLWVDIGSWWTRRQSLI